LAQYGGPAGGGPPSLRAAVRTLGTLGCPVAPAARSREIWPMLTPKVTELTRAGRTWVTTPLPPARPLSSLR